MTRPSRPCTRPGCPHLQPCPDHADRSWSRSNRRNTARVTGSAESRRAARILRRDGYRCHVCGGHGADEADHVVALSDGGADTDDNLAAIHGSPCHKRKTAAEAAAARARKTNPR